MKEITLPLTLTVHSAENVCFAFQIEIASVKDGNVTFRWNSQDITLRAGCNLVFQGSVERSALKPDDPEKAAVERIVAAAEKAFTEKKWFKKFTK